MNRRFQEYKECRVIFVDSLDVGISIRVGEFVFEPRKRREKYNRAKVKREFERRVRDEWER